MFNRIAGFTTKFTNIVSESLGKEKGTIAQNQRSVVQYSVISERRNALCAIIQEKHCYLQLRLFEKF